jgi:hypothetical protein
VEKQPKLTDTEIISIFESLGLATEEERRQALETKSKALPDGKPQPCVSELRTDLASSSAPIKGSQ